MSAYWILVLNLTNKSFHPTILLAEMGFQQFSPELITENEHKKLAQFYWHPWYSDHSSFYSGECSTPSFYKYFCKRRIGNFFGSKCNFSSSEAQILRWEQLILVSTPLKLKLWDDSQQCWFKILQACVKGSGTGSDHPHFCYTWSAVIRPLPKTAWSGERLSATFAWFCWVHTPSCCPWTLQPNS